MNTPRTCEKCGSPLPPQGGPCRKCLMDLGHDNGSSGEDLRIRDHRVIHPAVGGGSYGKVYLALTLTDTYRAIKVVRRDRFTEERPFRQEFAGLFKFAPISETHDGFVKIYYVGEDRDDGYFYYIMEVADDITSGQNIEPQKYKPKSL